MASPSASRPTSCHHCQRQACQGECPKCGKRKSGECANGVWVPVVVSREGGFIEWGWSCGACWLKNSGGDNGTVREGSK